jgi:hypothetical protein
MMEGLVPGFRRHVDPASFVIILLTLVLFMAALVVKGLGHDLLLEAGVFLVSVKLILMAYKASLTTQALTAELSTIRSSLARLEAELGRDGTVPTSRSLSPLR